MIFSMKNIMLEDLEGGEIQANAVEDLAYEAFEVCGYPKEVIENNLGHFIVTYSDNIWCCFHDDDFLFLIEKTVNTLGEVIFSVEFI